MIRVIVRGGLGNQMFQAAYALKLSLAHSLPFSFINAASIARVPRSWELDCFGLVAERESFLGVQGALARVAILRKLRSIYELPLFRSVHVEKEPYSSAATLSHAPRLVSGYWQRAEYFVDMEDTLQKFFRFPRLQQGLYVPNDRKRNVAIHVRRGDFVNDPIAAKQHLVCDVPWYQSAWQRLQATNCDSRAIVFSDDPAWAKHALCLTGEVHYVVDGGGAPAWVDMARMSMCDDFIISNSSYGWWAAFLGARGDKKVVVPKFWYVGIQSSDVGICPAAWWEHWY